MLCIRTVLLVSVSCLSAAAQTPQVVKQSSGPFAGIPFALSVDPTTVVYSSLLDPGPVLLKKAGFTVAVPLEMPLQPARPDFRAITLFGTPSPPFNVDGMSIGLDWVIADKSTGWMTSPLGWAAITFSVSRTTIGAVGSVVNSETTNGADGASGDLFVYFLPGNTALPPQFNDVVMRAVDSTETYLYGGTPALRGGIDAHDVFMALYEESDGLNGALPLTPTFYFTVSDATKLAVPPTWWGGTFASGATILETTWTGLGWTPIKPFRTYAQLSLGVGEDIDGLAVDVARGILLFSTTSAARDELLIADPAMMPATPLTYKTQGGGSNVSTKIGLVPGDQVKAICAMDPGATQIVQQAVVATPRTQLFPIATCTLSAFRTTLNNQPMLQVNLVGWPNNGVPGFGQVGFWATTQAINLNNMLQLCQVSRNPSSQFGGGPVSCMFPLPHGLRGPIVLVGGAISSPQGVLDVPFPIQIMF